jgi:hypothetical protein
MNIYLVVLIAVPTVAFMALSAEMARSRGRSVNAWRWFAFVTGPLPIGPLALFVLGNRKEPAS